MNIVNILMLHQVVWEREKLRIKRFCEEVNITETVSRYSVKMKHDV